MGTYRDAERDLKEYEDEFIDSGFVPFPDVYRVIEAIEETMTCVISQDDAQLFALEIARQLVDRVEKRRAAWIREYAATDPPPAHDSRERARTIGDDVGNEKGE